MEEVEKVNQKTIVTAKAIVIGTLLKIAFQAIGR